MSNKKSKIVSSNRKAITLSIAILAGLILGAIFGAVMPVWLEPVTGLISTMYLHALTMMIYPLVFCSLIVGIKGIGSVSATGKVGGQALLYYVGTTLLASLIGLVLPKALNIGSGVAIEMKNADVDAVGFTNLLDTVKNLIPANPFQSFVEGNMLQVLVFAIIIGIACLALGEKADPFLALCESVNEIAVKIVSAVMYVTPIGVFCSLAGTVHANGLATILSLAKVMIILYVTYALYIFIVYGVLIVKGLGHFSMKTFFVTILPAALNAFGTASSSATLPISKQCTDEMGVPNEISSLSLPLGATINMDAVSILMSFMIVFFANATGTDIPYSLLAVVLISNTLLSIGAPGVPNSAIATFAALSAIAGLPAGIMGMYVSVNVLADAGATCCNVIGDLACSVAMKRTCVFSNAEDAAGEGMEEILEEA
ncbi:MAG: dicarboxylate/amino acid:cation symporter [Eubacteriales bacterium]|nr:dicarboxylate/amino acid:cation symporter [Eubacteriales bacterium]